MTKATTSGEWVSVSKALARLNGLKTARVNWGIPFRRSRRQSGYTFTGRAVEVPLDGSEFVLGTFTHNNFPISGLNRTQRFEVHLVVNVKLDEGLQRRFTFPFSHNETPNRGNRLQQADRVGLSTLRATEAVEIDGQEYTLEIVGFKQDGKVVTEFISYENAANSAHIVAKFVPIVQEKPQPEPEPESESEPEPPTEFEPEAPEAEASTTFSFEVLNPDGSVFGRGCFSVDGEELPIDLAHVMGDHGRGTALTSFWYKDPLVGTMGIDQLMAMRFVHGVDGKPSRFTLNAADMPEDIQALAGGIATMDHPGLVSVHRNGEESQGCAGRRLSYPAPCREQVPATSAAESVAPPVDLVVVIDSSVSMRPDALSLSDSISAAIESAKSNCPSDLEVTYLGIEGRFSKTLFDTTIRQHLTALGVAEEAMRGRKRGTVASGGAQEDGARAIEDVSLHHDWRADARRAIFFLGDEGMEGGDTVDQDDYDAATRAIDVAVTEGVRVHTYLADSSAKAAIRAANEAAYERVASATGGQYFTSKDTLNGFKTMLEKVICASKEPAGEPDSKPCECSQARVEQDL